MRKMVMSLKEYVNFKREEATQKFEDLYCEYEEKGLVIEEKRKLITRIGHSFNEKRSSLFDINSLITTKKEQISSIVLDYFETPDFLDRVGVVKQEVDQLSKERDNLRRELESLEEEKLALIEEREGLLKLKGERPTPNQSYEQLLKVINEAESYVEPAECDFETGSCEVEATNLKFISGFDKVMSSLSSLYKSSLFRSQTELFMYEVDLDLDEEGFIKLSNLTFIREEPLEGKKLTYNLPVQLIAYNKEEHISRGEHIGTGYSYRSAFLVHELSSLYEFFHFVPKSYIHSEFSHCEETKKDFLTALSIFSPQEKDTESFIRIFHPKKSDDIKFKVLFELTEYPTDRL